VIRFILMIGVKRCLPKSNLILFHKRWLVLIDFMTEGWLIVGDSVDSEM
jgi:hypothetical protein